ncbi:hypothetical protein TKK_0016249 [Trichogramma kaykai]
MFPWTLSSMWILAYIDYQYDIHWTALVLEKVAGKFYAYHQDSQGEEFASSIKDALLPTSFTIVDARVEQRLLEDKHNCGIHAILNLMDIWRYLKKEQQKNREAVAATMSKKDARQRILTRRSQETFESYRIEFAEVLKNSPACDIGSGFVQNWVEWSLFNFDDDTIHVLFGMQANFRGFKLAARYRTIIYKAAELMDTSTTTYKRGNDDPLTALKGLYIVLNYDRVSKVLGKQFATENNYFLKLAGFFHGCRCPKVYPRVSYVHAYANIDASFSRHSRNHLLLGYFLTDKFAYEGQILEERKSNERHIAQLVTWLDKSQTSMHCRLEIVQVIDSHEDLSVSNHVIRRWSCMEGECDQTRLGDKRALGADM